MASHIQEFTRDLLSQCGALVEPAGPDALDVVAGADLRTRLDLADYERLVFSPDASERGRFIDYDSPLLEQMGRLVEASGRVAFIKGPGLPTKTIDAAHEIDRVLSLHNGVFRVQGMVPIDVVYLGFVFEYSLLADERVSGLVQVWVNPSTRSVVRSTSWLDTIEPVDREPAPGVLDSMDLPWPLAVAAARAALRPSLDEFVLGLTRRRDRDVARLRDYYEEIDREIRRKLTRTRLNAESRPRELDRLAATANAYRARLGEVADRSRVRVRIVPAGVFACEMTTYRIVVRLKRRSATVDAQFSWNPIDARVETRACDGCSAPVEAAWLCDDRVHYLCELCLDLCASCGRRYCRACHGGCPARH